MAAQDLSSRQTPGSTSFRNLRIIVGARERRAHLKQRLAKRADIVFERRHALRGCGDCLADALGIILKLLIDGSEQQFEARLVFGIANEQPPRPRVAVIVAHDLAGNDDSFRIRCSLVAEFGAFRIDDGSLAGFEIEIEPRHVTLVSSQLYKPRYGELITRPRGGNDNECVFDL